MLTNSPDQVVAGLAYAQAVKFEGVDILADSWGDWEGRGLDWGRGFRDAES